MLKLIKKSGRRIKNFPQSHKVHKENQETPHFASFFVCFVALWEKMKFDAGALKKITPPLFSLPAG